MRMATYMQRFSLISSTFNPFNFCTFYTKRLMQTTILDIDTPVYPMFECRRFITECMEAVGTSNKNAKALAVLLAEADYRGHYSHGMNRLDMYVRDVQSKTCDGVVTPEVLLETFATAWVDGHNGLGAVVGNFCMALAIKKAKDVGIGWVCAKGSNHYGIAGMYPLQALKEGLLGMSFTNTSPLMSPTRSKKAALGSNPLSLGAPATNGDAFLLDMATTAVALGKIEMQIRKHEPLPVGWAQDSKGSATTDAEAAYKASCLMPLGGSELTSGYKGFGLGLLVEIFCGILSGATYGPNVRKWGNTSRIANLGQCFIAVNPKCFAPGFEGRLSDLLNHIRNMEPADRHKPVMVAGDPEKLHMASVDKAHGVRYVKHQLDTCSLLSNSLNVRPMKPFIEINR